MLPSACPSTLADKAVRQPIKVSLLCAHLINLLRGETHRAMNEYTAEQLSLRGWCCVNDQNPNNTEITLHDLIFRGRNSQVSNRHSTVVLCHTTYTLWFSQSFFVNQLNVEVE